MPNYRVELSDYTAAGRRDIVNYSNLGHAVANIPITIPYSTMVAVVSSAPEPDLKEMCFYQINLDESIRLAGVSCRDLDIRIFLSDRRFQDILVYETEKYLSPAQIANIVPTLATTEEMNAALNWKQTA
ncbi:uncharacterized protein LOC119690193 [Teleopsis dalmanni]|uniref:uncharacterized protein LOC119690193 n=1 Tax=Teleopsis dalmanni TaxID=139649 RepID=UPI0018CEB601|nr:uncharacterized protein LOC119690193 [Teleopsis dalmanni]